MKRLESEMFTDPVRSFKRIGCRSESAKLEWIIALQAK